MSSNTPTPEEGVIATTSKDTAVATRDGYKADDQRGKENISSEDLRLPFLALAQKTSKAADPTEDTYITGLTFGDMYNTEFETIYGKGPIEFIPLFIRKRAYIPDENGRMGESIPWNDPRCEWPTEEQKKNWKGKGKPKPEGVRVLDVVAMLRMDGTLQPSVISFKSKSFGAGQSLATFISMADGASFDSKYRIKSVLDTNDAGKFAKFAVQPAGRTSPEEATKCSKKYDEWFTKRVVADDTLETDETPVSGAVDGQVVESKDVPF